MTCCAGHWGGDLETVISGGLWNTLIDPQPLDNAILSLAISARDAMEGYGQLTIETGSAVLDDDVWPEYVMVAVRIPSGRSSRYRRTYSRAFSRTKCEGKGSGFELSMVYRFLKQSGGHLGVYTEVGHGTTMRLYLPRTTQPEANLGDRTTVPATAWNETMLSSKTTMASVRHRSRCGPTPDIGR